MIRNSLAVSKRRCVNRLRLVFGTLAMLAYLLLLLPVGGVQAQADPPQPAPGSNQLLVKLSPDASLTDIVASVGLSSDNIVNELDPLGVGVISVPLDALETILAALQSEPGVEWVERDQPVFVTDLIPDDTEWPNQYGLINIHAPQGWEISTGDNTVVIAIIDTGVDLTHPDLAGKIVPGIDIYNGDNIPQDDFGHGTLMAGIAAASTDNGEGIAGTSWGAEIMPVKSLSQFGGGSYAQLAAGIVWAADHGAQIISMSVGGSNPSNTLESAVQYAAAKDVVLIGSAGNFSANQLLYPARYPEVIGVTATNQTNQVLSYANHGPGMSVAAPGVGILGTQLGGGYTVTTGTSPAVPFVAGLAAVIRGYNPGLTRLEVQNIIESTALDLAPAGYDQDSGYGLIQMDAALSITPPLPESNREGPVFEPAIELNGETADGGPPTAWTFHLHNPDPGSTEGITFRADVDPDLIIENVEASQGTVRPLDGHTIWVDLGALAGQSTADIIIRVSPTSDLPAGSVRCILGATAEQGYLLCGSWGQPAKPVLPEVLPAAGGQPVPPPTSRPIWLLAVVGGLFIFWSAIRYLAQRLS